MRVEKQRENGDVQQEEIFVEEIERRKTERGLMRS